MKLWVTRTEWGFIQLTLDKPTWTNHGWDSLHVLGAFGWDEEPECFEKIQDNSEPIETELTIKN